MQVSIPTLPSKKPHMPIPKDQFQSQASTLQRDPSKIMHSTTLYETDESQLEIENIVDGIQKYVNTVQVKTIERVKPYLIAFVLSLTSQQINHLHL